MPEPLLLNHKINCFQFQRALTPKKGNPELQFLGSAQSLMLFYICMKLLIYMYLDICSKYKELLFKGTQGGV